MRAATAMLPDASSSQDRIFTTPTAAIVLDGASAFVPVEVSPATYVDTLGRLLVAGLSDDPEIRLTDLLAEAIRQSASLLGLSPGSSPSSTVAIAREHGDYLDLLVLGDSQIATPHGVYVDNRLAHFAQPQRTAYRDRLAAGHGYDETHRGLLKTLQTEQAQHRNITDGYWIAEAIPAAAHHAITVRLTLDATPWLILATDGAHRPMKHLGVEWGSVAPKCHVELLQLLKYLETWEESIDPDGIMLPRAKQHDDKAIVCMVPEQSDPKMRHRL